MSDNPSVNRYLVDKALDHIDHALGRPTFPLRQSYRNYFACDADGDLAKAFAASPHWQAGQRVGDMGYFHVTDAGRAALDAHLRSLNRWHAFEVTFRGHARIVAASTAAKARYQRFLDIADVTDLDFGSFVVGAQVRRAS